jgi:molybdate transport system substrate-binding protein
MKGALDDIAVAYKVKAGVEIVATYASSSALAKQIEAGAPADVFISADAAWMDYLAEKNLIKPDTRKLIAGNTLVMVAKTSTSLKRDLSNLAITLDQEKLALADVTSVPAGKYAKAALQKLGLWSSVEPHVVMQDNVRAALALVARGEARLGIVYGSDAVAEPKVFVAAVFREDSHLPIVYPAAVIAASSNSDAAAFVAYLAGDEAQSILKQDGFTALK